MVQTDKEVNKVWFASPDSHSGVSQTLDFVQTDNTITLTIPDMQYWGMLVIE
jgi:dextranase